MKAKLVFIEVEKSRLYVVNGKIYIACLGTHVSKVTGNQPIKPVLVGGGEIKEGDEVVVTNVSNGYRAIKTHRGKVSPLSSPRQKIITQDTEELYEQIAKGELVEGEWYEFEEEVFAPMYASFEVRLSTPLKVVSETPFEKAIENEEESDFFVFQQSECMPCAAILDSEEFPCYNRGTQNENEHGKCEKWCGNDNYCKQSHPEPNEVTEEINQGTITRTKEQTEAIITALTKLSEKFYADMDKIVNGVEIIPPQDTTSQESKDYLKNYYNN